MIIKNIFYLIIIIIALYFIGNKLSASLENLCYIFKVPEFLIGFILGFATSVPELITFFEAQKNKFNNDKQTGVIEATNNLLTSNMVNLFVIQSIGIIISIFIK